MAESHADLYYEEVGPSNELKGFTKGFEKRSKNKRQEDERVKDLLNFQKQGTLKLGAKIAIKAFKAGTAQKIFIATNADDLTVRTIEHYAKIGNVEIVKLDLDNLELAQKLQKPFHVSMACVVGGKN